MEYPDLNKLHEFFEARTKEMYGNKGYIYAKMFRQSWPNTAGGFSLPGTVSGQAFTDEYTTVMVQYPHNVAMVSFGNEPAYIIKDFDSNKTFLKDYRNEILYGYAKAKEKYNAILIWKPGCESLYEHISTAGRQED